MESFKRKALTSTRLNGDGMSAVFSKPDVPDTPDLNSESEQKRRRDEARARQQNELRSRGRRSTFLGGSAGAAPNVKQLLGE